LQIQRLRPITDQIQLSSYALVYKQNQNRSPSIIEDETHRLYDDILGLTTRIEKTCSKKQGTPADLSTPSYRIFLWLRFLNKRQNLDDHMRTLYDFLEEINKQKTRIKSDPDHLLIKLDFSGYLYRRQTKANKTILQINESFISAPNPIKKSLIKAAFSRRTSNQIKAIKSFTSSHAYQALNHRISGKPIPNHVSCQGEIFDLKHLFKKINLEYFNGDLPQPRLIWSSRRSVRRLGYYHAEIHTIAINKKLDAKATSRLLVEYVLFHEMLHQNIGIKTSNGRRYAHTSLFKNEEKKFKGYKEAENLIKNLH
jgi:hypothetical protein